MGGQQRDTEEIRKRPDDSQAEQPQQRSETSNRILTEVSQDRFNDILKTAMSSSLANSMRSIASEFGNLLITGPDGKTAQEKTKHGRSELTDDKLTYYNPDGSKSSELKYRSNNTIESQTYYGDGREAFRYNLDEKGDRVSETRFEYEGGKKVGETTKNMDQRIVHQVKFGADDTTEIHYGKDGRPVSEKRTSKDGKTLISQRDYREDGTSKETQFGANGKISREVGFRGETKTSETVFDKNGRRLEESKFDFVDPSRLVSKSTFDPETQRKLTETSEFWSNNKPRQHTEFNADGSTTQTYFNKDGNASRTEKLDKDNKPVSRVDTKYDGQIKTSETTFGAGNKALSRVQFDKDGKTAVNETKFREDGMTPASITTFSERGRTELALRADGYMNKDVQTEFDSKGSKISQIKFQKDGLSKESESTFENNKLSTMTRFAPGMPERKDFSIKFREDGTRESVTTFRSDNKPAKEESHNRTKNFEYGSDGKLRFTQVVDKTDNSATWQNEKGETIRSRDAAGKEYVHRQGKDGKEEKVHDAPITMADGQLYNPYIQGGKPGGKPIPAEKQRELTALAMELGTKYSETSSKGPPALSAPKHAELMKDLGGRRDLTEAEKLNVLSEVIDEYKKGDKGKFRLSTEGFDKATLNDFARYEADQLRHQVINITNDDYHTRVANMPTEQERQAALDEHEGTRKQVFNTMRFAADAPYRTLKEFGVELPKIHVARGGLGHNDGDHEASRRQLTAIDAYKKGGMEAYAAKWADSYVSKYAQQRTASSQTPFDLPTPEPPLADRSQRQENKKDPNDGNQKLNERAVRQRPDGSIEAVTTFGPDNKPMTEESYDQLKKFEYGPGGNLAFTQTINKADNSSIVQNHKGEVVYSQDKYGNEFAHRRDADGKEQKLEAGKHEAAVHEFLNKMNLNMAAQMNKSDPQLEPDRATRAWESAKFLGKVAFDIYGLGQGGALSHSQMQSSGIRQEVAFPETPPSPKEWKQLYETVENETTRLGFKWGNCGEQAGCLSHQIFELIQKDNAAKDLQVRQAYGHGTSWAEVRFPNGKIATYDPWAKSSTQPKYMSNDSKVVHTPWYGAANR